MADISVTASAVVASVTALVEHGGKAGATITAGQVVYKDSSDGKFKLADNDSATAAVRTVYGIALHASLDGQPLSVIKRGPLTLNAALTAGTTYVLSSTAGGIAPQADAATGDEVVILGVATSTSVLDVNLKNTGVTL